MADGHISSALSFMRTFLLIREIKILAPTSRNPLLSSVMDHLKFFRSRVNAHTLYSDGFHKRL